MTYDRPVSAILTVPESRRLFTAAVTQTMILALRAAVLVCQVSPMATQKRTIEILLEQVIEVDGVTAEPMFGEYGVYLDG